MAVLRPLKVVIDNYPDGQTEEMDAVNNPEDAAAGTRKVPFSKVLYIEQDDFREDPPKEFFRLAPGREVRLALRLLHQVRERGEGRRRQRGRAALHLRPGDARRRRARRPQGEGHDPLGLGPTTPVDAEVRLYDHLFAKPDPDDGERIAPQAAVRKPQAPQSASDSVDVIDAEVTPEPPTGEPMGEATSTPDRSKSSRAPCSNPASLVPLLPRSINSNATAISALTLTQQQTNSSSTAPSR